MRAQKLQLLDGFHALRHHFQPQAVRQRHDGVHDGGVVGVGRQIGDEGAVDLEKVDRKTLQVAQRRVAGAEIVDRHPHAHALEGSQGRDIVVGMVHQDAFGQFQFQARGLEAGFGEQSPHQAGQVALVELAGRQIDRHAQPGPAVLMQLADFADGGAQHPLAQRQHQAAVLGDRDEAGRRQQPEFGVIPADQRLGAGDGVGAKIPFGLVI